MGINVEQLQDKMDQFNPAHRRIHFHKESPISYNPWAEAHLIWPPLSLSAALWTWQITYWSADVGANVFSAWAAAATACSSQPVLNPLDLQLSPPPPPSTPPSGSEWGPPACLLIPPCPCLSSKVWKGSQTNAICSGRKKPAGEASFGPRDPILLKTRSTKRFRAKQTPAEHKSREGKQVEAEMERTKKKSNLHCFNPRWRWRSHSALTQQLVRRRSRRLTVLLSSKTSTCPSHTSVTQHKSEINSSAVQGLMTKL